MVEIRKGNSNDAEAIVGVMTSAEESGNMLFDPGERKIDPASFAKFIDAINENEKSGIFVAEEDEEILGYLIAQNEKPKRIAHRAYIVVGVHSDSRGKGIGKALFVHMLEWAEKVHLHRIDLTVIAKNDAAIALYKKMGFEIEGIKRDSLFIDDEYVDEFYMSKLL